MSEISDRIMSVEPVAGRRKGTAPVIRKLKLRHPELTDSEIARRVGCRPSNVSGVLKTFLGKNSAKQLQEFQESKADVYDALQLRVLGAVTPAKLTKSPAQSLILSAAILEDKARLVRGQATGINVTVLMYAVAAMRAMPSNISSIPPNPQAIGDQSTEE